MNLIEQARRQINRLAEEIAHLSEMDLAPAEYYGEFLQRLLTAIAAPAGAVWVRTPQGNLQLQYQINMRQVGLDNAENGRQSHDELLRHAAMKGQPGMVAPQSGLGPPEGGGVAAGNPTDYVVLIAPIMVDKQVAGLVEIWQDPNRGPEAQRGFLNFMVKMAAMASSYTRNHQLRQMVGQQAVWTQLEAFARQIHGSLNPTEVAYLIANEGRRLVECDRVSIGQRRGKRPHVEAISGADVVEKRSNLVQLMRTLFERVMTWGEKLIYTGTKDDTLPPDVNKALDAYLAESNSKLLVVLPLRDERETNTKKPPRSALMMECFEPAASPEQLVARLEVVGRHSTSALYNAAEHKRIPMRFVWAPLAKVQEGLGGKARAILALIGVLLLILIACMIFVPYPLKMEAKGQLQPVKRRWIYSPIDAQVVKFMEGVAPGKRVRKDQVLIQMHDVQTGLKIISLQAEIERNAQQANELSQKLNDQSFARQAGPAEKARLISDRIQAEAQRDAKKAELEELVKRTNADRQNPGVFRLKSPIDGIVLSSDNFTETLTLKGVKPNEPLLRLGFPGVPNEQGENNLADWEIELKIPQKHIGQVLSAYQTNDPREELDVDLLVKSMPTQTFKGKLPRYKVAREAQPNRDDNNEAEPVVLAWVRIHPINGDIPPEYQLPPKVLLTGAEVHAKVRCGSHALGYSLFYGVWEFCYEKIVFFF
jgi:hypothetical protein